MEMAELVCSGLLLQCMSLIRINWLVDLLGANSSSISRETTKLSNGYSKQRLFVTCSLIMCSLGIQLHITILFALNVFD